MPVVMINVAEGRLTEHEQKRKIMEGITAAFGNVGVPPQALHIIMNVVPKENWARGGQFLSERDK